MQSFHPMLPGWMDGDSAAGGAGGGAAIGGSALDARAIQEALKAGAAAARHGDRPPPPRHRPAPSAASAGAARAAARARAPRCRPGRGWDGARRRDEMLNFTYYRRHTFIAVLYHSPTDTIGVSSEATLGRSL